MDDCCAAHLRRRRRLPTLHRLFASLLYLVALPTFAGAPQAEKIHFHIEAGEFEDTITQFGDQARVLVSYANDNFVGIRTNAVSGEYEIDRALSLLLQGTPLVAQWRRDPDGSQWVVIRLAKQEGGTTSTYHIDGGNAALTLNEFSAQSDVQVLFDFNIVNERRTRPIDGSYSANDALARMLRGTGLGYDWVNDHTIAVTPSNIPGSRLVRWWQRFKRRLKMQSGDSAEVVVAANAVDDERPSPGARILAIDREQLERDDVATAQDFLRTRPELFGGGPNEGTVLGAEQQSNTALGVGANFRGLGAGATVALINGRPMAPSGDAAAFSDISNVPFGAIDHIDMIPEGGTAQYGGNAAGGVINFVMRDTFDGARTRARYGFAQGSTLAEQEVDQLWGAQWGGASSLVAFEYYKRDALFASDRAQATSDLTSFGGSNFDSPFGNPGTLMVGSQTWAIPRGQNGRSLSVSDLQAGTPALHDVNAGSTALPSQERFNLYARSTLPVADNTELLVDALFGSRHFSKSITGEAAPLIVPTSNPWYINPTGNLAQPVQVLYGFLQDLGPETLSGTVNTGNIAVGFTHEAQRNWIMKGEAGYAFEDQRTRLDNLVHFNALNLALADPNPVTAFNPFGDGSYTNPDTLVGLRAQDHFTFDSSNWFGRVATDGPVLSVPGGDLRLNAGSEVRRERLGQFLAIADAPSSSQTQYRNVWSAYAEVRLPIAQPANRLPAIESLELSAAERIAHYSDVGTVTTPSLTATWELIKSLRLRATEAWIFKPPTLGDLSSATEGNEITVVPDSRSLTGQSLALVSIGGNPGLRPERGRSWSLGFDFRPANVPDLTLAITHFDIYLDGRVNKLSLSQDVLGDPRFASLVNLTPTPAERAAICNRGMFYGDPTNCLTAAVPIVDGRSLNISRARTVGYDIAAKYALETRVGHFDLGLDGTYVTTFAEALVPDSPLINIVNTDHNPLKMRARASLGYRRGGLEVTTFVNFTGHYRDIESVPTRNVAAWTTLDARLGYEFGAAALSAVSNLRFTVSVQNLFGSDPPFLNNQVGVGWDQENASPLGRQLRFAVQKHW